MHLHDLLSQVPLAERTRRRLQRALQNGGRDFYPLVQVTRKFLLPPVFSVEPGGTTDCCVKWAGRL